MRVFRCCGKIIVSIAATVLVAAAALAQVDPIPGSLHTENPGSFNAGTGRIGNINIATFDTLVDAAIQPDRKIVLAGSCAASGTTQICLARLNQDGTLDASFDGPGGSGDGKFQFQLGGASTSLSSIAIQADGKILIGASCSPAPSERIFCVTRLLPNGSVDSRFGFPGIGGINYTQVSISPTGLSIVRAIRIRADGKIIVAGDCANGDREFCLLQLLSNGAVDTSFGQGASPNGTVLFDVGPGDDFVYDLQLQADGKIVVLGSCYGVALSSDFCIARLLPNGAFDSALVGPAGGSLGSGRMRVTFPLNADARSLAIQADGKLVIAGQCNATGTTDLCIARLNSDGSFDEYFDGSSGSANGRRVYNLNAGANEFVGRVAIQADGKILVTAACPSTTTSYDFCVIRLYDDGALDRSFDGASGSGNGAFRVAMGPASGVSSRYVDNATLALQSDGRIVLAGTCDYFDGSNARSAFCAARLNGGPHANRVCRLDVDGDGVIGATNDALILNRVTRGLRGSNVISGIGFAAHATRKTWPAIRDYLVAHCQVEVH